MSLSPRLAALNAGESGRSPEGTAMLAASSRKHIASGAGLGAARRSARIPIQRDIVTPPSTTKVVPTT